MIPVDKFLPFVQPYAEAVPPAAARIALMKTASDFCRKTLVWRAVIPVEVEGANVNMPDAQEWLVAKIISASFNGVPLEFTNENMLDTQYGNWREQVGSPNRYTVVSGDTERIRLFPAPEAKGELVLSVALMPKVLSKYLPEVLFNRYWKALSYGALADVYQIEGQTFYDPGKAMSYQALYTQCVRAAITEANRSGGRTHGEVRPRRII